MIYFDQQLSGDDKPWIILVHGLTCAHSDWSPVTVLLRHQFNVLAVDLRGHGQSAHLPGPYSIETLAGDVADVVAQLGITRAILAGHSMGTRIITALNEQVPDLARGMLFVDGSRQASGSPDDIARDIDNLLPSDDKMVNFIEQMFASMFIDNDHFVDRKSIIGRATSTPTAVFRALLSGLLTWDATRLPYSLKKITCPLSILQSTIVDQNRQRTTLKADQQTPYTNFIRNQVPQATLRILEDTGHFSQLENPQAVAEAIAELGQ